MTPSILNLSVQQVSIPVLACNRAAPIIGYPKPVMSNHITFLGDGSQTGAYILWLNVRADIILAFGRFQRGRPVVVSRGMVAYVGSAMGPMGASALAGRLLRHATRSGDRPPHAIRDVMWSAFLMAELGRPELKRPAAKRLHWHIDYLLDQTEVEISRMTAIRTAARLESELAKRLSALPGVSPLAPRLGASDMPGGSHLLRYLDPGLPDRIAAIISDLVEL